MEESKETKVDTEELKSEASNTVSQVKETIKNVDIKKDSIETKGFIKDMFKDPLGKIKEIATKNTGKFLTYAIIILVIWVLAELIKECFTLNTIWGYSNFGKSVLLIIKATITPIISVLVMSLIVFLMNTKNKKSLTTVITEIIVANIPLVIASIVSLLTIISSQITMITRPFTALCNVIATILTYFATKALFNVEKNSDFIKKFVAIEAIYYVAYIIVSFLGIYI